ncbi:unnamed protein product, partial [Amoebophrya sp. A25]
DQQLLLLREEQHEDDQQLSEIEEDDDDEALAPSHLHQTPPHQRSSAFKQDCFQTPPPRRALFLDHEEAELHLNEQLDGLEAEKEVREKQRYDDENYSHVKR